MVYENRSLYVLPEGHHCVGSTGSMEALARNGQGEFDHIHLG